MSTVAEIKALSFTPAQVAIDWTDGRSSLFTSLWLADNDPVHRDAHSGQRLIDLADLPAEPQIGSASAFGGQLRIEWRGGAPITSIAVDWLSLQRDRPVAGAPRPVTLWGAGARLDANRDFAWLSHDQLAGRGAVAAPWFRRLGLEGITFVKRVPAHDGAILAAVAPIGQVQETNYGRLFDVRAVAKAENLAYTDLGLGLHTDNPYRDPVPGFQVLHCLLPAADGGDNLFADGFALADYLRDRDPESFAVLSQRAVPYRYRAKDVDLCAERPLIQLGMGGEVIAVHYNNRSIAPLAPDTPGLGQYYAAYRRFAGLLREPQFQMRMRMAQGDMVVFDNWRVLHARTSFTAARHLQGCYLTKDSVYSRIALESRHEHI